MRSKAYIFSLLLCLIFVASGLSVAQSYNPFNQRDDQYRLLGLKRAKDAYEVARSDFDRQEELYNKGLITNLEFERARSIYSDAEVNYQQSLLAVLFEQQYISISDAVKYHAKDGVKHVRLTLINASGGTEEFHKLLNIDDELFRSLQPDVVNNVYVSILNNDNAIISQPYEAKISQLRYGEPQTIDFSLLEDLDAVTVFIIYGNGAQRSMRIFLQKDASVNRVEVQSEQFSQEVELGSKASYDLTLENFSGTNNTFSLEIVNLPEQISHNFRDASGQVRLSQIKFTESSRTKRAILQVTLPDRSTGEVAMDKSISFYALIMPNDRKSEIPSLHDREWTETELEELDIGYVKLELLPRGKGELLVRAPQLYHSILADETVEMNVDIINEGTRRLDQVEVTTDLPLNWTRVISPQNMSMLDPGKENRVNFAFTPPEGVSVGKYEVRIQTTGLSNGQLVTGSDKIVTIEVRAETNIAGTAVIVLFILALVGGIIVYGVRLSRR